MAEKMSVLRFLRVSQRSYSSGNSNVMWTTVHVLQVSRNLWNLRILRGGRFQNLCGENKNERHGMTWCLSSPLDVMAHIVWQTRPRSANTCTKGVFSRRYWATSDMEAITEGTFESKFQGLRVLWYTVYRDDGIYGIYVEEGFRIMWRKQE